MIKNETVLAEAEQIEKETAGTGLYLSLILLLAGFLSFFAAWNEGYANTYYAAAVKSMLMNFNNFFFVSFDPGGFVSVDKPPLGLWIQALSATIFGFQGWSLILPQALAAIISTALVYHLVQRKFGKRTGLVSALIFTLTPIVGAVSRTNNFDSVVVMLVLLAAWCLIVAAEKGSLKLLSLSMVLVGLGFNVKMLQAYMVLPAFYLVYMLSPANDTRKKIKHLCVATVILLIVSLSWATVVDMTPADQRPYVGSSQTNSVLELALGYNGIQRVLPGDSPFGARASFGNGEGAMPNMPSGDMPDNGNMPGAMAGPASGGIPTGGMPDNGSVPGGMAQFTPGDMPSGGMGGMAGPGGEGGEAGIFRLFNQQMAGQISWLLPLAIIGFFSAFILIRKNKDKLSGEKILSLILWGMWMLPMLAYFSISGFFHRYYLIMLAPSIAALCGIGLMALWKEYRNNGSLSILLPLSLIISAAVECLIISRYPALSSWMLPVICIVCLISAAALVLSKYGMVKAKKFIGILTAFGVVALLIAPAFWSITPIIYHSESQLPYAGPELGYSNASGMQGAGMGMGLTDDPGLTQYLLKNMGTDRYLVAVPNAMAATGLILETGKPVMAIGGFLGSDPILTVDKLKKMVSDGEVRYFLVTGMPGFSRSSSTDNNASNNVSSTDELSDNARMSFMPGGGQSDITNWVKANGKLVPESEWMNGPASGGANASSQQGGFGASELYDLKGAAS